MGWGFPPQQAAKAACVRLGASGGFFSAPGDGKRFGAGAAGKFCSVMPHRENRPPRPAPRDGLRSLRAAFAEHISALLPVGSGAKLSWTMHGGDRDREEGLRPLEGTVCSWCPECGGKTAGKWEAHPPEGGWTAAAAAAGAVAGAAVLVWRSDDCRCHVPGS